MVSTFFSFLLSGGSGGNGGGGCSQARRKGRLTVIVDFEAVKAVVDATHRYKEIFYSE